jgi:hypothetical protein
MIKTIKNEKQKMKIFGKANHTLKINVMYFCYMAFNMGSKLKCECWQKSKLSRNIDQTIFLRGQLLLFTLLKHTTFIKYICFNTFQDK